MVFRIFLDINPPLQELCVMKCLTNHRVRHVDVSLYTTEGRVLHP